MQEGLLWYDDNPSRDLAEKIGQAARRYRKKFGASPNVCYVHQSTLQPSEDAGNGKAQKVGGVRVSSLPTILQHHFWLGQEENPRKPA